MHIEGVKAVLIVYLVLHEEETTEILFIIYVAMIVTGNWWKLQYIGCLYVYERWKQNPSFHQKYS